MRSAEFRPEPYLQVSLLALWSGMGKLVYIRYAGHGVSRPRRWGRPRSCTPDPYVYQYTIVAKVRGDTDCATCYVALLRLVHGEGS